MTGASVASAAPDDTFFADSGTAENYLSSSNASGGPFFGLNINSVVGATRFYNAGYTGSRSVLTNIEGGHVWNQHETLRHNTVQLNASGFAGTALGEYDRHATWSAQAMAGRLTSGSYYGNGIAYGATLWSGSLATNYGTPAYSLQWGWSNGNAFTYPYATAMLTGVNGRRTDVINGSWGFGDSSGNNVFTVALDGMARQSRTTLVFSAGNEGPASNTLRSPGAGFNSIVVGALGSDTSTTPYSTISDFSSRGPVPYYDPVNGTIANARARVDITAPGQNLTLAYYGGVSGGNRTGTDTTNGATDFYSFNAAGTSFSAPIVSGGAGLLCDVGYDRFGGGNSVDATVIKATLLNSAAKPAGWDNGQTTTGGVVTTTQGLDYTYGAGIMNLNQAFDQYTAGTTDVVGTAQGNLGTVQNIGWDFGIINTNGANDYYIGSTLAGNTLFNATLNWMANEQYVGTAAGGAITANFLSFTDLNLELWSVTGGSPSSLIAQSASLYNNTEHFSFFLPDAGQYMLRVSWAGERFDLVNNSSERYGLAWSSTAVTVVVPESNTAWLMLVAALPIGLGVSRTRRS